MSDRIARTHTDKKPLHYGFLTTRVLHTEREPLVANADEPRTVGQLIDERLEQLRNPWGGTEPSRDWIQPVIHSITLELPLED